MRWSFTPKVTEDHFLKKIVKMLLAIYNNPKLHSYGQVMTLFYVKVSD